MKLMKKTLLLPLVIAFIGGLAAGTVPASAADVVKMKTTTAHSPSNWVWPIYEAFAEEVKERTNGRVELEFYTPGQLVPYIQYLEALRAGISDIAHVVPGYYPSEFALSQGFNLPYKWEDSVTGYRLWNALYDKYMNIDYFNLGIDIIAGWPAAGYDLFTIDRPIEKMEDAADLRLRTNNETTASIWKAMGAIPVFMSGSKVPDALGKGMLDGAPGPASWLNDMQVWEHGKPGYLTRTGSIPQGLGGLGVSLNPRHKFVNLSEEDQQAIRVAADNWVRRLSEESDTIRDEALVLLQAKGVIYSDWPQSEKDRLVAATAEVEKEWLAWTRKEGLPGQMMLDEMNALLKKWKDE